MLHKNSSESFIFCVSFDSTPTSLFPPKHSAFKFEPLSVDNDVLSNEAAPATCRFDKDVLGLFFAFSKLPEDF